jgi:cytoskeletal protein CcmA (bactofilin family)
MFGKKGPAGTIDSLIGAGAIVEGELRFKGGLRIDGEVRGNVIGEPGAPSLLVLSEQGRIVGSVQASQLVVNGTIEGPVQADVLIELQPKARVTGAVRYKALEMHPGAVVDGVLAHFDGLESERPSLKLASSND